MSWQITWRAGRKCGKSEIKRVHPNLEIKGNKAKAISAELLELSLKNKLEETGKTR